MDEREEEIKYLKQVVEARERDLLNSKSENARLMEHAESYEEMHEVALIFQIYFT